MYLKIDHRNNSSRSDYSQLDPVDINLQLQLNVSNLIIKQHTTHNARSFARDQRNSNI